MTSLHHGDARGEIELGIPILNETLSLRAHDVIGDIGHAWGRRGSHECGNARVISRWPADRGQVKPRILGRAIVFEPAYANAEIEAGCGRNTVVVHSGGRVRGVLLRATVRTNPSAERVDGQVEHVPIIKPNKELFFVRNVLVDSGNHLVLISSCSGGGGEIVREFARFRRRRPQVQQLF